MIIDQKMFKGIDYVTGAGVVTTEYILNESGRIIVPGGVKGTFIGMTHGFRFPMILWDGKKKPIPTPFDSFKYVEGEEPKSIEVSH